MMFETESKLYEGEVLTGVYYVDDERPSYQQEKRDVGELPEQPLADRYWDDDYEWERSYDLLGKHK
jgi:pyruvate ferredoxin oxidoreductase beta subunit